MDLFGSIGGVLSTLFAPHPDAIDPAATLDTPPQAPELTPPVQNVAPAAQPSTGDLQIDAFLHMLRACEGTAGPDGYRTLFGGKLFDSYAQHPHVLSPFTNKLGQVQYTDAAGAYQFLWRTWSELQSTLQLPDFSPASQDAAAIELIRRAGAIDAIQAGSLHDAVSKCARLWASLPGGPYPQAAKSWDFVDAAYRQGGGFIAY